MTGPSLAWTVALAVGCGAPPKPADTPCAGVDCGEGDTAPLADAPPAESDSASPEDSGLVIESDSGAAAGPSDTGAPVDTGAATLPSLAFANAGFDDEMVDWTLQSGVSDIDPDADATSVQAVQTGDILYESSDVFTAFEGDGALKMWGRFWGMQSFMYAHQTLAIEPGAVVSVGAHAWHHRDDAIANPGTYGAIKVQFLDGNGRVLTEHLSNTLTHETPTDTWVPLAVTATAPYGTAAVRAGPFHLHCEGVWSGCYDPGATYFDAMTIAQTATASPDGEYVFGSAETATGIIRSGRQFFMMRSGEPFAVNGLSMGRVTDELLASAASRGANAIRTYALGSVADDLAKAEAHGIGVFAGHWLSHYVASFSDEDYLDGVRAELIAAIEAHKDSPALIAWVLGNEMDFVHSPAEMAAGWAFVDELAGLIHSLDPDHPVVTVLAGTDAAELNAITAMAPNLDAIGVNSYGGIYGVGSAVKDSSYDGPFFVTEWGVNGFWERPSTLWSRPIEETSSEKRANVAERYTMMNGWDGCMGNFAFLWGFKQERTPTWFSISVEDESSVGRPDFLNGEFTSIADVLEAEWRGVPPANLAPDFSAIRVDGMVPTESVTLTVGSTVTAEVDVEAHGETGAIAYYWELVREIDPALYGAGGSAEPRPETHAVYGPFSEPFMTFTVPTDTDSSHNNEFRLFAYGFDAPDEDGRSRVATANIPMRFVR